MSTSNDKERALRRSGTFHSKAGAVGDAQFLDHAFFDARDLIQVKYEMLRRVSSDGWSVSRAADRFGFSRPTFYQAKKAFEEGGLFALVPERRGPRSARKLTPDLVLFLKQRLSEDPRLGYSELAEELESHAGVRVHPRTVKRHVESQQKKR